jgi:hypothetical protein
MTGEAQTSKMPNIFQRPAAVGAAALNGGIACTVSSKGLSSRELSGVVGGREESTGMAGHQTK